MLVMTTVRGKSHEWCVMSQMSREQVTDMRADGIEVDVIENTVPDWIAASGLARPWCFFQDIWNLRNPFGK